MITIDADANILFFKNITKLKKLDPMNADVSRKIASATFLYLIIIAAVAEDVVLL
jgi:hypothetical protein